MIWLSFEKWNHKGGKLFFYTRIFKDGYKWTPFVRIKKRYKKVRR